MINLKLFIVILMTVSFTAAHAQTVTLDYYFNRETKKDVSGKMQRFSLHVGRQDSGRFFDVGQCF